MALVGQFPGQHQLHVAVLGIGGDCFARNLERLIKLVGVAVGVHLALVAALGGIAAQIDHLLVGGNGIVGFVFFHVDPAQPLQEDAAVVLFLVGISAIGVRDRSGLIAACSGRPARLRRAGPGYRAAALRCNPPQARWDRASAPCGWWPARLHTCPGGAGSRRCGPERSSVLRIGLGKCLVLP